MKSVMVERYLKGLTELDLGSDLESEIVKSGLCELYELDEIRDQFIELLQGDRYIVDYTCRSGAHIRITREIEGIKLIIEKNE